MTRIVTLGDSITLGMGDPAPGGGWRGWACLLAAGLPKPELHNLAANGAQAKHVERDQLPNALLLRPHVASVVVGINDTLRAGFDPVRTGQATARTVAALTAERRHRDHHAAARPGADVRAAVRARPAAVAADAGGQRRDSTGSRRTTGPCTGTRRPTRRPTTGATGRWTGCTPTSAGTG